MIAPSLEQQLTVLQHRLDEAFERIGELEKEVAASRRNGSPATSRQLPFGMDSPAMKFALELCAEIFPGKVSIEVASAPDDPGAQWCVLLVSCADETKTCLDREAEFGRRLNAAFPAESVDIRLAVIPQ